MYIYLYIDVAMTILALVELLKIALIIIEKCKRHSRLTLSNITKTRQFRSNRNYWNPQYLNINLRLYVVVFILEIKMMIS